MRGGASSGVRRRFRRLFRPRGQVAHVLLTLPPLAARGRPVRLACLIHAASVHSEPGSNSPLLKSLTAPEGALLFWFYLTQHQGASRFLGKPYTIFRICIALFNFQGAFPFSGRQGYTLHPIFPFANRLAVFFGKSANFPRDLRDGKDRSDARGSFPRQAFSRPLRRSRPSCPSSPFGNLLFCRAPCVAPVPPVAPVPSRPAFPRPLRRSCPSRRSRPFKASLPPRALLVAPVPPVAPVPSRPAFLKASVAAWH